MGNSQLQCTIVSCGLWRHRRKIQLAGNVSPTDSGAVTTMNEHT